MKNMKRSKKSKANQGQDVAILKDIRESLVSTQISGEPDVRDVIIQRPKRNRISHFEFSLTGNVTSSAVSETDGAITFQLNNLSGYTTLTSLFDQYRIVGITVRFYPSQPYTAATGQLFTAFDYDDATAVPIATLVQRDTLKVAPANAYFERSLVPRLAIAAYAGAFTSFGNTQGLWIDSGSPGVVHYGLKYGVPASASANSWTYVARYSIQCRSQI
jgi:hypothetical protein